MAEDINFGSGMNNTSMSREAGLDISDLFQNEDSIDISTYMTSANLELCDDDLFQSLFPSDDNRDSSNVKKEKPDPFESELSDWWTEPGSAYSACSSAAPSPVQFFATPPVTPKPEGSFASPETGRQQVQQDRSSQFSMSRTQLTPIIITEDHSGATLSHSTPATTMAPVKKDPDSISDTVYMIKREVDTNLSPKYLLPGLVKAERVESNGYGDVVYSKAMKRPLAPSASLTTVGGEPKQAKKSKEMSKDSEEYKLKRERNNIAVRRSRDKAKMKTVETQIKVSELSSENKRLHERVSELTHELNTLKTLLKSMPVTRNNALQS